MTVSISRMNIEYYLSTVAVGDTSESRKHLTNYYTASGDPAGRWFGKGLSDIDRANEQTVTKSDARAIFEHIEHPDTRVGLGKRPMKKTQAPENAMSASRRLVHKKTREAVAGFDLTFSAPKSVSTLWAVADTATQTAVHQAHQNAVRKSLTWLEDNVIQSRAGDGGIVKVDVEGIIATLFDHFDSRAGDPQLHTHAVLANRVKRSSDGAWVTLDSYALHKWVVTASEMYNAVLFDELAQLAQTHTDQRQPLEAFLKVEDSERNRRVELTGVPDELIIEFSQRTSAIEERKNELIDQWKARNGENISDENILQLRRQATLESRQAKPEEKLPLSSRLYQWKMRSLALGIFPEKVVQAATGHHNPIYTLESFTPEALDEIATNVLERTIIKHPTFNRANLLASTHRLMVNIRCAELTDREAIANAIVDTALEKAVTLTPERYQLPELTQAGLSLRGTSVFDRVKDRLYTTASILEIEKDLMVAATDSHGSHLEDQALTRATLQSHISDKGYALAPDQLEAAFEVTTSSSSISAIIGPAGTGKTSTLAGVRAAWEKTHGTDSIIGLAPSAAAASVLSKDLGIATDNTAKWLYESVGEGVSARAQRYASINQRITALETARAKNPTAKNLVAALDAQRTELATLVAEQAKYQLKAGQLLIVDEASMSSTFDIHQLYQQVQEAGAKMLLVGDPKQLDAVDAGGFLGWMENQGHSANLTSVWRFEADWEKEASLQLRQGNTDVLETYQEHDRIKVASDPLDAAYQGWSQDTRAGKTAMLIAGTNADVLELNQRAQAERIERKEVDTDSPFTIRSGLTAYTGDTILARQNNRQLLDSKGDFIKNGTRLTVQSVNSDTITAIREDTQAVVEIPQAYAQDSIELGYACTIHRAQGLTVQNGHVALDSSYNREQLYVAMTRGKENNLMYAPTHVEQEDFPDNWNMMKLQGPETTEEFLSAILRKTNADKTAHEVMDAEHGWANDLGRATSELDYVADLSAIRRTHQWFAETFNQDPRAVADTPELKRLVKAVKESAQDYADLPPTVTNVADATAYFEAHRNKSSISILPELNHLTGDEATVAQAIEEKVNDRLSQLKAVHAQQPWFIMASTKYPHAIDSILLWRALSHQQEAQSMLGDPPSTSEKRLTALYEKVTSALEASERQDAEFFAYPDPDDFTTGHEWDEIATEETYTPHDSPRFEPEHEQHVGWN